MGITTINGKNHVLLHRSSEFGFGGYTTIDEKNVVLSVDSGDSH
jgi:hypothetical protein